MTTTPPIATGAPEPDPAPRRTWKSPDDPTYKPNRKRDQMTPEEHAAYRARILARRKARRAYREAGGFDRVRYYTDTWKRPRRSKR